MKQANQTNCKDDFTCQHVKKKQDKSIYIYHLIKRDLCICEKCEAKLRKQILEQDTIETSNEGLASRNKFHGIDDMIRPAHPIHPIYYPPKESKEFKSIKKSIKKLRLLRSIL